MIFVPNIKFLNAISMTIKELRQQHNLTQEKLAAVSDIHWRTVQKVERGAKNITVGLFYCFAKGFGLSPDELMLLVQ